MAATLLIFESERSGQCRRLHGYLAQVLQRNANQDTFRIVSVDVDARPDLAARFRATTVPTLMIVESNKVRRRLVGPSRPRELRAFLEPWLRPGRRTRSDASLAHV
ncbi:MAG TPA: thioredoxin family protein [Gaiellaceae bacterium]|nr:thioredoxin family protein [Gaiellaceae bacterium]